MRRRSRRSWSKGRSVCGQVRIGSCRRSRVGRCVCRRTRACSGGRMGRRDCWPALYFDHKLRRVCALAAGETHRGRARRGQSQIEGTISGYIGGHVYTCPGVGAHGSGRSKHNSDCWRVVVIDRQFSPGIITDTARLVALARGTRTKHT